MERDAVELLKEDHRKVEDFFAQFGQSEDPKDKQYIVDNVIIELKVHTKVEEEIFYPAFKKETEENDLIKEAIEEHDEVDELIAEIEELEAGSEELDEKFQKLIENVKHHVEEEEAEMFPKAYESELDLEELGQKMFQRKTELLEEMEEKSQKKSSKKSKSKKE